MLSEEHRVEPNILALWCFVRGDTDPSTFEAWLCAERELEELLGSELYLESISTDFGSGDAVFGLRKRLNDFVSGATDRDCECVTLPHLAVVDMGDEGLVFQKFVEEKRRGEPFWWLLLYRCSVCDESWLVAQEERQNDVFCLRRLDSAQAEAVLTDDRWPSEFNLYEDLLRIGRQAGRSVRFADPKDSSLVATIEDLARARPGIRIEEIARLLNLEAELASALAAKLPREYLRLIRF